MSRSLEERAAKAAQTRASHEADRQALLTEEGWRPIDKNKEWFSYPQKRASLAYTKVNFRAPTTTSLSLFTTFIPKTLVELMLASVDENALHMKRRRPDGNVNMTPTLDKAYAALAVQVRLLGLQQRSVESSHDPHHYQHHMKTCGSDAVDIERDRCILACDSYYLDASSRALLLAASVTFTASVQRNRFKREVHAVHTPGSTDQVGDFSGIYRPNTGETFVFHFDPETGVGRMYNYARGFQRVADAATVQANKGHTPVYHYYRVLYRLCDQFNRALHDRCWPYKRGGHGRKGELGSQNDFMMGCILQNVINAFCAIQGLNRVDVEFKEFCVNLADELFKMSRDFVGK